MTRIVWMVCALAVLVAANVFAAPKAKAHAAKGISATAITEASPAPKTPASDRVVAVVNDQVLTLSQLQARTELNIRQAGIKAPSADQRNAMTKRTLGMLIDEELQRQYAEGNN